MGRSLYMKLTLIVVGVIACGVGAWLFLGSRDLIGSRNIESATSSGDGTAESLVFTGSMRQLLARRGAWECIVSSNAGGVVTEGKAYGANGEVRGDFSSQVPQVGVVESHLIVREGSVYTWTPMSDQGFRFPLGMAEGEAEVSADVSAPLTNDYQFACTAWAPTESTFTLPSGVTF